MGRAIVFGQLAESATDPVDIAVEGESAGAFTPARRSTFVRFVLPVAQGDTSVPAQLPDLETNK
jgi:hypothetical protein